MNYQIQRKSLDAKRWEMIDKSGENLQLMQTAIDELITAAKINTTGDSYRLVDEEGEVVYAPSDKDVGWVAEGIEDTEHDSIEDLADL